MHVILMVRRQREDAADRALAAIGREILQWRIHAEQARSGLAALAASRIREIQCVANAVHYQSSDARYRTLVHESAEAAKKIEKLEKARAEQMAAYIAARRNREVAEKLEEERSAAHEAEVALREQKWNEDMFLARKVSNSNRSMSSGHLFGTKESA
ncbi:MAG TPA: hypothetical protein VGU25_00295 [Acidobacteriaceae bacterium]|nr:hypothetical protein [Acidobacteriaceae bacterium]